MMQLINRQHGIMPVLNKSSEVGSQPHDLEVVSCLHGLAHALLHHQLYTQNPLSVKEACSLTCKSAGNQSNVSSCSDNKSPKLRHSTCSLQFWIHLFVRLVSIVASKILASNNEAYILSYIAHNKQPRCISNSQECTCHQGGRYPGHCLRARLCHRNRLSKPTMHEAMVLCPLQSATSNPALDDLGPSQTPH